LGCPDLGEDKGGIMSRRFSTFEGVFTPTVLSILGVIMYLRLGWVVGTVGLWRAIVIVVGANLITAATALSMSSIVTNIRIGTGGAFSIILKSLGIETAGAVGIPLYLSQAISVAFYIAGFSECWVRVFPAHNPALVSLVVWLGVLLVSYYSARAAFRLQYVIMAAVGLSLVSVAFGGDPSYAGSPVVRGLNPSGFWGAFAIFFPAVTGVLAGASMSGELTDPRRSIPRGTLAAVAVTFVIYLGLTCWLAFHSSADQLVANTAILMDLGRWRVLVIAGVMGAALSSALSLSVGAPRTLLAIGEQGLIPYSGIFSRINHRGEPTGAVLLTALVALVTLYLGSLDSVAALLTEFFLITYGMINLSVFIEQSIGIASFRPALKIPSWLSLLGAIGCFGVMLLINPVFTGVAIAAILTIYVVLVRRELKSHSPDVRSGLLIFLAENFVKAALKLPYHPKIWKPNVFCPVGDTALLRRVLPLLRAIIAPSGRILFLHVFHRQGTPAGRTGPGQGASVQSCKDDLVRAIAPLKDDRLFVENAVVETPDTLNGIAVAMQMSKEMFFRPNTVFCLLENQGQSAQEIMARAAREGLGVIALKFHPKQQFGYEKTLNLWIRRNSPNINLAILMALQIQKNWDGRVRLLQAVADEREGIEAQAYLEMLKNTLRFPADGTEIQILTGGFWDVLMTAPRADINIFGMADQPDAGMINKVYGIMETSVLFLRDSEFESAMA